MERMNVAQLVVSIIAMILIASPLIVLSYIAGRKSQSQGKSPRLDGLQPDVALSGSHWKVEIDGDQDPSTADSFEIRMDQIGCRIVASGRSINGGRYSLEGIVHRGRLCCVTIDETREGQTLGTVTAELTPDLRSMTGMKTRWSVSAQTLTIRKATFTRMDSLVSFPEPTVRY